MALRAFTRHAIAAAALAAGIRVVEDDALAIEMEFVLGRPSVSSAQRARLAAYALGLSRAARKALEAVRLYYAPWPST